MVDRQTTRAPSFLQKVVSTARTWFGTYSTQESGEGYRVAVSSDNLQKLVLNDFLVNTFRGGYPDYHFKITEVSALSPSRGKETDASQDGFEG